MCLYSRQKLELQDFLQQQRTITSTNKLGIKHTVDCVAFPVVSPKNSKVKSKRANRQSPKQQSCFNNQPYEH